MTLTGTLAQADWEAHRPAVFGAAYRILGSVADAEDVTQDVWLRTVDSDLAAVRDLRAWLVTIAARTSFNLLNSARVRRESYVGPWLPEPLLTGPDVSEQILVDDSVSTAMLVVMEQLSPSERVALVLHDIFDFPFGRIAEVLGCTPAAARKLASRARPRIAAVEERPRASRAEAERLLDAFKAAADEGNMARLVELLHPDVVYVADGGGKVTVARKPVYGVERVARLMIRSIEMARPDEFRALEVNGEPALAALRWGNLVWLDTVETMEGQVTVFRRLANPEKLAHIAHIGHI